MNKILLNLLLCILVIALAGQTVLSIQKIVVEEGEPVNLNVRASDANKDTLVYEFSKPLNEEGKWQTGYDDAGEYLVNVSVLDGKLKTTQTVIVIVKDKNRIPVIEKINDVVVDETGNVSITPNVNDPDGDKVDVFFSEPLNKNGIWQTKYGDAGAYDIKITASDGKSTVEERVKINVLKKNQAPKIESKSPQEDNIETEENSNVQFSISASDADGEVVSYAWLLDEKKVSEESQYTYLPDYNSAGAHTIEAAAFDGKGASKAVWNVNVKNVNRAPEFVDLNREIAVNEGEKIVLDLNAVDPDRDEIYYKISGPVGDNKEWQTGYNDSGDYYTDVTISDKKLFNSARIKITVNDVDRDPLFEKIDNAEIEEGKDISLELKAADPDGDNIAFSAENLPSGATFSGNKFYYKPDYAVVRKPDNRLKGILEDLRIENLIYRENKDFYVKFIAQGRANSTNQTVKIRVRNHNFAPELNAMSDIYINEGEELEIKANATDFDNDRLSYTIIGPGRKGVWKTGYNDSGTYIYNISVSDGKESDSGTVKVIVNDVNRKPVFNKAGKTTAKEGENVSVKISAYDPDGDPVAIITENPPKKSRFADGEFKWNIGYDTVKGKEEKEDIIITFIADDGKSGNDSVKLDVNFEITNVNRLPVIEDSTGDIKKIYTGDTRIFSVDAYDPDKDNLTYTWKFGLLDELAGKNKLKRTFNYSGEKTVEVIVSDGENSVSKEWNFVVKEKPAVKKQATAKPVQKQPAQKPAATQPAAAKIAVANTAAKTTTQQTAPAPQPAQPKAIKMDVYEVVG